MESRSAVKPFPLAAKGDGLLHLPAPYPTFLIKKHTLGLVSPFLSELYAVSNHVFVSKKDDPEAVCVLAKMFHNVGIGLAAKDITLERIAGIAELSLKWKCTKSLGTYPQVWLTALAEGHDGSYEPWDSWLSIGRAFGRDDVVKSVIEKHGEKLWRSRGYVDIESMKDIIDAKIIGKYRFSARMPVPVHQNNTG